MHNLCAARYEESLVQDDASLTATAWSPDSDSVICAFGPTPGDPTIRLKRRFISIEAKETEDGFHPIASWDAPCPLPDLVCDEILLMHYFSDSATTCLVLAGGDLILVREKPTHDQEAIEIVGSIDVGIAAAAWAPDQEILAIVTRADNLILMSRALEPLNEVTLTPDDLLASRHVSVGWGKKETQFQGKRAKAMRDPTMPEHTDEGQLSPLEDYSTNISWRGDGVYLAINSVVPQSRRVIRVFSREGVLDSVSEPVDGLEAALSWRPAGNLIAGIKRSIVDPDHERLEVVFFERNGLRHGEFDLRLQEGQSAAPAKKVSLSWNIDSSVLAISFLDSVQFWTMGNYHYYLKQDIAMAPQLQQKPISVRWNPERSLDCCLYWGQKLAAISFELEVCTGSTVSPSDYGTVAVIDGRVLKITPLRQAGVPPPMSYCEVRIEGNIMDCAISLNGQYIAIANSLELAIYKWKSQAHPNQRAEQPFRFATDFEMVLTTRMTDLFDGLQQCLKLCFQADRYVYVMSTSQNGKAAQCYKLDISSTSSPASPVTLPKNAQRLHTDVKRSTVWASGGNSTVLIGSEDEDVVTDTLHFDGDFSTTGIFAAGPPHEQINGIVGAQKFSQVRLKANGSLWVNSRLLARDCTSFALTEGHLLFTTAQHFLKFVHLSVPEAIEVPDDLPETDERCRAIERGAKIVTVVPSTYAAILQMPRGNLETIYPRVLVVSGIRKSLAHLDYRTAFLACQVHQVDMNILHDHLSSMFLENVPKFIDDLRKPGRIDEFLSKLRDEDVTETLYKDTSKPSHQLSGTKDPGTTLEGTNTAKVAPNESKVNRICNTFIKALNTKGSKYLTNVITAHVCKRPPDLTAALMLVSSLRKNSQDEADLAVSHLCFLTDTNRLYDAALSLYDLDLTLLVAQNAQRDPREYMPFLQSLHSLPTLRRQYQIDNHLKQYKKALLSLHALKEHSEVESYTIRHGLYTTAIDLYKYDTENLPKITILYAEHLESQSSYASAAILRESLGQHDLAYPLYALAHLWRESLTCATLIPLEQSKLINLATSLAATCAEESRDYRSAATIYIDYLKDIPSAARLLCKGSYFTEATRLLALHDHSVEISRIIDPGLTEKFGEIVELVADCKTQLAAQVPRIAELRKKKEEDPLAFYGGDAAAMAADGIDIPDNISLAPTDATTVGGQSLFTRYGSNASKFGGTVASNVSRKTSKTKRREERKRARGKKGSVYEEEYLISSVGRLIERINGVQDEVKRLVSGMLRRGLRDQGIKVEEIMKEICVLCENARAQVWQIEDEVQPQDDLDADMAAGGRQIRPNGADGVYWDSQQQVTAPHQKQAPMVKRWSENVLNVR